VKGQHLYYGEVTFITCAPSDSLPTKAKNVGYWKNFQRP